MNKRILLIMLGLTLTISVIGCGKENSSNNNSAPQVATEKEETYDLNKETKNPYYYDTPEEVINAYIKAINNKNQTAAIKCWLDTRTNLEYLSPMELNEIESIEVSELTYSQSYSDFCAKQLDGHEVKAYDSKYHINYKVGSDRKSKFPKDSYDITFVAVRENDTNGWRLYSGVIKF